MRKHGKGRIEIGRERLNCKSSASDQKGFLAQILAPVLISILTHSLPAHSQNWVRIHYSGDMDSVAFGIVLPLLLLFLFIYLFIYMYLIC